MHILLLEQEKQFKKREKLLTKDEWYTLFSKVHCVYTHDNLYLYSTVDLLYTIHASAIRGTEEVVDHGKQLRPL